MTSPSFGPSFGAGPVDITQLLHRVERGDADAYNELARVVHATLKQIAANRLRRERPNHFYQTSDLVQEAYLRLIKIKGIAWQDRAHFYRVAALQMRRILVEYARRERPEHHDSVLIDDLPGVRLDDSPGILRVDEALRDLARIDARRALILELRYFGGFKLEEVAEITGVSLSTVKRQWNGVKAFAKLQFNLRTTNSSGTPHAAPTQR